MLLGMAAVCLGTVLALAYLPDIPYLWIIFALAVLAASAYHPIILSFRQWRGRRNARKCWE